MSMTQKRGLGRGLSDLGLNELLTEIDDASLADSKTELKKLMIDVIQPGHYQPRRQMGKDTLEELANSIRAQGIIQPIVVRPVGQRYEIIAGERRWRAAQLAGLKEVPAVIRPITDEVAVTMSLIENIQRQNLNAIEEAAALQRLLDEFKMTHEEIAEAVGKSRTSVTNSLRLLKLNPDVKTLLEQGHLDMGHARALLALEGFQQSEAANIIVNRALSVRETEKLIQYWQSESKSSANRPAIDPDVARLQHHLSDKLGAAITIRHGAKGKGKLIIHYNSADELEGILDRIR
ncbi:ParB/RepB/Spo0J family partition protein [Coxiella endosymbiont of Ornithodoros amblus]|uniref:ParB/RepB/Spo0J family partition protein n=1 Tax=Coxiella endosymbiont of Ornithodoros amblus TaxID=1656166 RepID=UPI00244DF4AA|nr:ParB/RepB/Spo0J family partition protein [Coxiella endosymbiont of Ornithodoros amblus]MBW5803019.1 ParB/RepB/Spo0J family partition protein [Coxiella endosymbiont of Ornithodoros amblus]